MCACVCVYTLQYKSIIFRFNKHVSLLQNELDNTYSIYISQEINFTFIIQKREYQKEKRS